METRNQLRQKRSDPDKFEKTVNLLLTQIRRGVFEMKFQLNVDKPFTDPDCLLKGCEKITKLPCINIKHRSDKKQSRPDAEFIEIPLTPGSKQQCLYIVIDAKFY